MNKAGTTGVIRKLICVNIGILMVAGIIACCFSSCRESGDIAPVLNPAYINVVDADTNAINFYQNGTRLNDVSAVGPGSKSGYINTTAGTNIYQFKIAGAVNYLINNVQFTLDSGSYYSVFAAGETADKIFLTNDAGGTAIKSTQAAVRFVNASAAAPNLTIAIQDTLYFPNHVFTSASKFLATTAGVSSIKVFITGSGTPIISQSVTLQPGTYYTLFTKGVPGGTGKSAFGVVLTFN